MRSGQIIEADAPALPETWQLQLVRVHERTTKITHLIRILLNIGGKMTIECTNFRAYENKSLRGWANLFIPKMGIEIFGCAVYEKDGKRWVNMPQRQWKDPETGEEKYVNVIKLRDKAHWEAFKDSAMQSIDAWIAANSKPSLEESQAFEGTPF